MCECPAGKKFLVYRETIGALDNLIRQTGEYIQSAEVSKFVGPKRRLMFHLWPQLTKARSHFLIQHLPSGNTKSFLLFE